jgi:hypothetical protein
MVNYFKRFGPSRKPADSRQHLSIFQFGMADRTRTFRVAGDKPGPGTIKGCANLKHSFHRAPRQNSSISDSARRTPILGHSADFAVHGLRL